MNGKKFDSEQYLVLRSQNASCTIKQDARVEESVKRNLEAEYGKLRDDVHVTDLTLCMRQALFRKLQPVPPSTKQLGYFFDGARRHEALQKLYGQGVIEKEIEFEGVKATIDILDSIGPIEFKTTRAKNAISEHWIRQLAYYMVATNSNFGTLQIQRILPGKQKGESQEENLFPAFIIELNKEQREKWHQDFKERKDRFLSAYQSKDPSKAPLFRGDNDWVCSECPYKAQCDKIERVSQ
ncbi:MAG: PD-(D/E)XK nuclease family protein [Nitrososphaerota archaeon]|nr:PD-(D/E)XK nuclease family protein [Nitrososphaerota archaeon]